MGHEEGQVVVPQLLVRLRVAEIQTFRVRLLRYPDIFPFILHFFFLSEDVGLELGIVHHCSGTRWSFVSQGCRWWYRLLPRLVL